VVGLFMSKRPTSLVEPTLVSAISLEPDVRPTDPELIPTAPTTAWLKAVLRLGAPPWRHRQPPGGCENPHRRGRSILSVMELHSLVVLGADFVGGDLGGRIASTSEGSPIVAMGSVRFPGGGLNGRK